MNFSKKCKNCKAENHPRRKVCTNCGKPFNGAIISVPPATPNNSLELITEMRSRINNSNTKILFHQNQVLRLEIAIQEIYNHLEIKS